MQNIIFIWITLSAFLQFFQKIVELAHDTTAICEKFAQKKKETVTYNTIDCYLVALNGFLAFVALDEKILILCKPPILFGMVNTDFYLLCRFRGEDETGKCGPFGG